MYILRVVKWVKHQEPSMQRKTRCESLVTLACIDIDSLLRTLLTNFHSLTKAIFDARPRHTNLSSFSNKQKKGLLLVESVEDSCIISLMKSLMS